MTKRRHPEATVLPVHFEDRSGTEVERRDSLAVMFGVERGAGVPAGLAS